MKTSEIISGFAAGSRKMMSSLLTPPTMFGLITLIYLILFVPRLTSPGIWVNDEGNRIAVIRSYASGKNGALPDVLKKVRMPALKPYAPPYLFQDPSGSWRSAYSAFFPRLMAKFRDLRTRHLLLTVMGLFSIFLVGRLARNLGRPPEEQALAMALTGLASPVLFYSGLMLEWIPALLLITASMVDLTHMMDADSPPKHAVWYSIGGGVLLGFSTYFREEAFVIAAVFSAAVLCMTCVEWKWRTLFLTSAAICIVPFLLANYWTSGSLFGIHHQVYRTLEHSQTFWEHLHSIGYFLFQLPSGNQWIAAAVSVTALTGGLLPDSNPCAERIRKAALLTALLLGGYLLGVLIATPARYELTLQSQSLIPFLPWILLPLIGVRTLCRGPRGSQFFFFFLCTYAAAMLIAVCLNSSVAGIFWGPRHFLLLIPLFSVLAAACFSQYRSALIVLLLTAMGISGIGMWTQIERKAYSETIQRTVCSLPDRALIGSDVFWLPEELSGSPRNGQMILLENSSGLQSLGRLTKGCEKQEFYLLLSPIFSAIHPEDLTAVMADYLPEIVQELSPPSMPILHLRLLRFKRNSPSPPQTSPGK